MSDWQAERTMTRKQFTWTLKRLNMTIAGSGRYLGISERHVRRYAKGSAEIPAAHALLLRSLLHHGDVPLVPKWQSDRSK